MRTCRPLPEVEAGSPEAAAGRWYDVDILDLTGVDGVDAVVVQLVAAPADADVQLPGEVTVPPSWFRGTTSFRFRLSAEGRIQGGTLNVDEVLGRTLPELLGTGLETLIHPDDLPAARRAWSRITGTTDRTPPCRQRMLLADGTWRWFESMSWNVLDVPDLGVVIAEFRDIDEQVEAERIQHLATRAHQRMVTVVDEVDDMIMVGRLDVGLVYVNEAAAELVGPDAVGQPLRSRMRPALAAFAGAVIEPAIRRNERWTGDIDVLVGGEPRTMATTVTPVVEDDGNEVYFGVVMHDVTEARRHAEELAVLARRDPLTGLPNRLALMEQLAELLEGDPDTVITIDFIDLDNLKVVNDGLGHSAGDQLLRAVGAELLAQPGRIVARFGGDEFVVVHEGLSEVEAARSARTLLSAIEAVTVVGVSSHISASVGVASCRRGDLDPESAIRDADAAMYVAKRTGRARIVAFDDTMRQVVARRFSIESGLRESLSDGRLDLHLQPVIDLVHGDVVSGYEALARWPLAAPSEFIPIAEESGLILPLGRWALHQALGALNRIAAISPALGEQRMGVNVSGHQLVEPGFAAMVIDALAEHAVNPEHLVLELTESVLIDSRDEIDDVLRRLRDHGVSLALDDFGSGYSSLGYLRRYPIDVLKLDTSYTQALLTDHGTRIIAEGIITMASRLGLRVVAEGVETPDELELARDLGITWAQGYLLGRPEPIDAVVEGLRAAHPPT
ncbi:EAL domain-containing protein [Aquihabitans sp. G128]|uniref:putative bifunctional diguanylate cyclase/phosphodiesterase n=1 Tax=Aquihabitans sp. G128 TaxID=2849779 RepID=UPI001C20F6D4|nr:GGDEF and EAL domain-containing protein [Aquihabitans sp. G128]QXC62358.1 EAL domain-containing protein [Aquihabitans sp. G128]